MSGVILQPEWVAPSRTALLIVDMQVDFASPEGALARAGADLSAAPAALDQAERLAGAARGAGVPVVFVGLRTRPETDAPSWRLWIERRGGYPERELALCRADSPGAAFVGPIPQCADRVVWKPRYSAFVGTTLDAELRAAGVDTLVICGVTTECCVDQTVRDAFSLDYQLFVVADACAAYSTSLHAHTLEVLACSYAIVADSQAVSAAWRRRN